MTKKHPNIFATRKKVKEFFWNIQKYYWILNEKVEEDKEGASGMYKQKLYKAALETRSKVPLNNGLRQNKRSHSKVGIFIWKYL